MITDLVSLLMIHEWLEENAPQYAGEWAKQIPPNYPDQINYAIQAIKGSTPNMGATFVSQTCIAKHAIQRHQLQDVAILGAGRPHGFSPSPDQVLYYTDQIPDVVEAAEAANYQTRQVDVGNPDDLKKLSGAKSVVGTGLFHFFPDPVLIQLFEGLAAVGVEKAVFNHADPVTGQEHFDASAPHVTLYPRTSDQVKALLTTGWSIESVVTQGEFIADFPEIGQKLAQQPHRANVYVAIR